MRFRVSFASIYSCNQTTTSDRLGANRRTVGDPCNLQLYAVGFLLSIMSKLAVTHSILTWRQLYIAQDIPLLFIIIFLRTSHFFSLSSTSSFPQHHIMAPQSPQHGTGGLEPSGMTSASSNIPPIETQLHCRHQLVHRNTTNAATENITQYAHLTLVRKSGSSMNKKPHMIGCAYSYHQAASHQLTISYTAGVCRELSEQFIAAHNGKPPW